MIVFIYFFEKMAVLRDPINKKKMKEDVSFVFCLCFFTLCTL